jgi:hypothetical protein
MMGHNSPFLGDNLLSAFTRVSSSAVAPFHDGMHLGDAEHC